jgi:hypothetical protein
MFLCSIVANCRENSILSIAGQPVPFSGASVLIPDDQPTDKFAPSGPLTSKTKSAPGLASGLREATQTHSIGIKMRQSILKSAAIALATGAALTILASAPCYAGFIVDPNPGGTKLYNDDANSNVSAFTANVGSGGPTVNVHTTGNSQTGAGFAIIKPTGDSLLTQVVFTPTDPTLFTAFNFRGQIAPTGYTGIIKLTIVDLSDIHFDFTFTGVAGPNSDFASIGVYSPDFDTIKSATIWADTGERFKTVKQIQFTERPETTTTEVPEPLTMSLFAAGLAGMAGLRRRKSKSVAAAA